MERCGVVEVRNVGDTGGEHCGNPVTSWCSDCLTPTCEAHTKQCDVCHDVFCTSCFLSHEHAKPVKAADHSQEGAFGKLIWPHRGRLIWPHLMS